MRVTRLCVTGHRPDKLPTWANVFDFALAVFRHHAPPDAAFDIGMAVGWDMACANACRTLGLPYYAVIPFEGQDKLWPADVRLLYRDLVEHAVDVVVVSPFAHKVAFTERNKVMVERCPDGVWALWNGSPGGTSHCVNYALQRGRKVWNYWDSFNRYSPVPVPGGFME